MHGSTRSSGELKGTRNLAGDVSAPAAVAAMLASLVVGTQTRNQVWQWSLLVMVGLLGWAVLRTQTRRVVALAVLVVGF
jgi:hypothetical protein